MLLVDTTVWIDYFVDRTTPEVTHLIAAVVQRENICLCGVVVTEILQGISNLKEYHQVSSVLQNLIFLNMSWETHVAAAEIYRTLRRRGITIRKTIDCMIAAVALENDIPLLHRDRDFDPIKKYCGLKIYEPIS